MLHPLIWIPSRWHTRAFIVLCALALSMLVIMRWVHQPLISDAVPGGIIDFELAASLDASLAIQVAWGEKGRMYAALGLGLDYLYLLLYALALSLACSRFAYWGEGQGRLSVVMSWVPIAAALFDALENYALARLLFGEVREGWVIVARDCALLKFALLAVVALYLVYAAAQMVKVRWRVFAG